MRKDGEAGVLAADRLQEVLEDGVLVVPADEALHVGELRFLAEARGLEVGDLVVELQEGRLELRDDRVLVVARIADERALRLASLGRVARDVALVRHAAGVACERAAEEHVQAVVAVEIRLVVGAAAVDGVEVEARRAEVDQRVGGVRLLQTAGRVEGDVVVEELPEVGVAGGDPGVFLGVGLVVGRFPLVFRDHLLREVGQHFLGVVGWRKRPEHPSEASLELLRTARHVEAAKADAVRAEDVGKAEVAAAVEGGNFGVIRVFERGNGSHGIHLLKYGVMRRPFSPPGGSSSRTPGNSPSA